MFFLVVVPQTIQYNTYSQSVYIAFGVIRNLEMISSVGEDVHWLYTDTILF